MRTIFLADDDPTLRRGLDLALTGRGYSVRTAASGPELLSLLEEAERPDLLLLDVAMPGMSGLEVLNRLRGDRRWSDLPVLVLTASDDASVVTATREQGAVEVVVKPFRLGELVARIEERLPKAPGAEG